jgi:hypothetical protein
MPELQPMELPDEPLLEEEDDELPPGEELDHFGGEDELAGSAGLPHAGSPMTGGTSRDGGAVASPMAAGRVDSPTSPLTDPIRFSKLPVSAMHAP